MKKVMAAVTLFSACGAAVSGLLYARLGLGALLSLAITGATVFYHLAMRLAVGAAADRVMGGRADWRRPWYRPRPWEPGLYRFLRVKQWKKHLPTYDPSAFDPHRRTPEELVQAMCQAEVIHELIAGLSFAPVLAIPWAGAAPVFWLTSIAAAAFDLAFVLIQRCNRPRLVRLMEKKARRAARAEQKTGEK